MSKLSSIKNHIHSIREINSIFNAMKSLSVVELSKTTKLINNYKQMSLTFESTLNDFFSFYPKHRIKAPQYKKLYILIGSERGFCGSFNEKIIKSYQTIPEIKPDSRVVAVGRKLESKLVDKIVPSKVIESLSVSEDILTITAQLKEVMNEYSAKEYLVITNIEKNEEYETIQKVINIDFSHQKQRHTYPYPPELYLPPSDFYKNIIDQYLTIEIANILIGSFYIENKERLRHMEAASDKIERKLIQLNLKKNSVRQNEITQELEIILLNSNL